MDTVIWWLIALAIIGIIGILAYRFYYTPPLSHIAEKQQVSYLTHLRYHRRLVYQISQIEVINLLDKLEKAYSSAGHGVYYGQGLMMHLKHIPPQLTISFFSPTEDDLARHIWQLQQMIGGSPDGTTHE
ncbi:MAG: hypothetical protein ACTSRC_14645 [Candidatus Helarchaeota archaeon]